MSLTIVGKWGKNLAVRIPMDVARTAGLVDGEPVAIELLDGDIVVRRGAAHARARQDAERAAAEIVAESRLYSLGPWSIRDLLDDGRRE